LPVSSPFVARPLNGPTCTRDPRFTTGCYVAVSINVRMSQSGRLLPDAVPGIDPFLKFATVSFRELHFALSYAPAKALNRKALWAYSDNEVRHSAAALACATDLSPISYFAAEVVIDAQW
jgi:hypothetical protein